MTMFQQTQALRVAVIAATAMLAAGCDDQGSPLEVRVCRSSSLCWARCKAAPRTVR